MASKCSSEVTTVYQCSECDHCSQNLEDATLHAVQEHGEEDRDDEEEVREDSEEDSYPQIKIKQDKDSLSSDEDYSTVLKKFNGNYEQQRDREAKDSVWSASTTRALIDCVHEHFSELSKATKKKAIWEQIKNSLSNSQVSLSCLTAVKCERQWKSLLAEQRRYLANSKGYGKSKLKKPEFFEEVAEVVGEDGSQLVSDRDPVVAPFRSKGKKESSSHLHFPFGEESPAGSSGAAATLSPDTMTVLNRLISMLEQREAANRKFRTEVLEIEREKLKYVQRFVESREAFNAKRLQLMRDWMMTQVKSKRKRGSE